MIPKYIIWHELGICLDDAYQIRVEDLLASFRTPVQPSDTRRIELEMGAVRIVHSKSALRATQQLAELDIEASGKLLREQKRRVSETTLDTRDIGPVYTGCKAELFLRQALLQPKPAHIRAKDLSNIHAPTGPPLCQSVYGR
ncbi:hypothetical protein [Altererythrobacter sp. C41]|uniref:hypothetical protein n=1 Tax=Altererythrobacter sp. C41 TaxID=2806021 RepID=UPI003FCD539D